MKKAQTGIMPTIALVIGLTVSILILVFLGSMGGSVYEQVEDKITTIGNTAVTHYSFTANNGSSNQSNLGHGFIWKGSLVIVNQTTAEPSVIGLGNFTIDYDSGAIYVTAGVIPPANATGKTLYANYTYGAKEIQGHIRESVKTSFDSLNNVGAYLPLIVLAVVLVIVMGSILALGGKSGGGGTAL